MFILLVYIWAVGIITGIFVPENWCLGFAFSFNYIPFINESMQMVLMNFMMMIPMGVMIPMVFKRMRTWKRMSLIAILAPTIIETTQMLFVGRIADIDDIITNFAGCMAGYAIYLILMKMFCNKMGKPIGLGTAAIGIEFCALCWGVTLRRWCLGDMVFRKLGFQTWSNNRDGILAMSGIHYTEIVTMVLLTLAFVLCRKYKEDYMAKAGSVLAIATGVYAVILLV